LPDSIGTLSDLILLDVSYNPLSGPLPKSLMQLEELRILRHSSTNLCVPDDAEFIAWLNSLPTWSGDDETCAVTSTEDQVVSPTGFALLGNYPNPFNPSTTISYVLPEQAAVSLRVFDANGREVRELIHSDQPAGSYRVNFNGAGLPSGTYFYRLAAGRQSATGTMVLLR
jgi:hypothetical protein